MDFKDNLISSRLISSKEFYVVCKKNILLFDNIKKWYIQEYGTRLKDLNGLNYIGRNRKELHIFHENGHFVSETSAYSAYNLPDELKKHPTIIIL